MRYSFGDIVLVPFPFPFPFTDQSTSKKRPAVVVSSNAYHQARPDLVIMAVTSQLRPTTHFGEVMVQDWQAAGLLKPSAIKPVITTIEQSLVIRAMGKLAPDDGAALRRTIASIFG